MNLIFKKFLKDPRNIGAIVESSENSAKKISNIINKTKIKNVVEIGGGTGSLSRFIQNKDLTIVERDMDFVKLLKNTYPSSNIVNSCGIDFLKNYRDKYGLFTSIPLIKNQTTIDLTNLINEHIKNGQLDWFIILGYKFFDQFKKVNFKNHDRHFVLKNLPPAFIWHYY